VLGYLLIYFAAIVEGEIYYSTVSAEAVAGRLFWPAVLAAGALGGATGDQIWFYLLRGRIHWLEHDPSGSGFLARRRRRVAAVFRRYRDRVVEHVHAHETGLILISRFLPGLRTVIPITCAYAGTRPLKFTILNLISAFAWAAAIMAFIKGGSSTLSAFGLDVWWGPFIPAVLLVLFFRWLASPPRRHTH
jgi:membrane protein DedA with SNARE-associated domain